MSLNWLTTADCDAVRLGRGHAAEGLEREHHVAQVLVRGSRCSWRPRGAPRRRPRASCRRDGRCAASRIWSASSWATPPSAGAQPLVLALEHGLRERELGELARGRPVSRARRRRSPAPGHRHALGEPAPVADLLLGLVDHVHDPGGDRLDEHLRALPLEEGEHVEVAVALGGLRPELAGDLDDRLHAEPVDRNLIEAVRAPVRARGCTRRSGADARTCRGTRRP